MKLTKEVKENIDSYFDNITLVELEKKLIDYNIIPKKGLTYNQKIVNNKITFTKWFKKHLKEMYDLSDYAIKKVMNAFEGEIKKTELMKLIESK